MPDRTSAEMMGAMTASAVRANSLAHQEELMNDLSFEALTRRASLLTLGAAGLAGLAGPIAADARKKGKGKDKCKKQVGTCQEGLADLCLVAFGADSVEACLDAFGPCCEFLKGCNTAQAFACAVEVAESL
jgi:hypothetical protein